MIKMNKYLLIPLMIGILMIIIFISVAQTLTSVWIFIPGVILTFVVYLKTYYKRIPDPLKVLPLYLLLMGIQCLHFAEEYVTDFHVELPNLLGQEPYPLDYWLTFNMTAYFFFIIGGIAIYKKKKEYMILPLFFIVIGVLLNGLGHVLLSIYSGGYFPGLYSALLYVLLGPILIKRIVYDATSSHLETEKFM